MARPREAGVPRVLAIGPYRFHFYSNEGVEPPHIHVERDKKHAKFWLAPVVLAHSSGFRSHELKWIETLVARHERRFLEEWNEFFTS